jgi:hypothetical protein
MFLLLCGGVIEMILFTIPVFSERFMKPLGFRLLVTGAVVASAIAQVCIAYEQPVSIWRGL